MYRLTEEYAVNDLRLETIHNLFVQQITLLSKQSARRRR